MKSAATNLLSSLLFIFVSTAVAGANPSVAGGSAGPNPSAGASRVAPNDPFRLAPGEKVFDCKMPEVWNFLYCINMNTGRGQVGVNQENQFVWDRPIFICPKDYVGLCCKKKGNSVDLKNCGDMHEVPRSSL